MKKRIEIYKKCVIREQLISTTEQEERFAKIIANLEKDLNIVEKLVCIYDIL